MGLGNSKQYDLEKSGIEKGLTGSYNFKGETVYPIKYEPLDDARQIFHEYAEIPEYTSPTQTTSSKDENVVEIHIEPPPQEQFDQQETDNRAFTEEHRGNDEQENYQSDCSQEIFCIGERDGQTRVDGGNVDPQVKDTPKCQNGSEDRGGNSHAGKEYPNEERDDAETEPKCADGNTEVLSGIGVQNGVPISDMSRYIDCDEGGYCDEAERTGYLTCFHQECTTIQGFEDRVPEMGEEDEDPYDTIHSLRSTINDEEVTVRKEVFCRGDTLQTGIINDEEVTVRKEVFCRGDTLQTGREDAGSTSFDDSAISSCTLESSGSGFVCPIYHSPHDCGQGCLDKHRSKYIEYLVEVFRPLLEKRVHVEELLPHLTFLQSEKSRILAKNGVSNKDGIYELLKCIHNNGTAGKWPAFLDALYKTDNKHLKTLVDGTEEYDAYYDQKILQIYTPEVMRQIHLKDFTDHLYQEGVINDRDKQRIENIALTKCELDAVYELLDTIPNRLRNWNEIFPQVLRRLGCSYIAEKLEEATSPTEISKKRKKKKKKKKINKQKKANEYTDFKCVSKEKENAICNEKMAREENYDDTLVNTKHVPCPTNTVLLALPSVNKKKNDSRPPLPPRSQPVQTGIHPISSKLIEDSKDREESAIHNANQHQQELVTDLDCPPLPPRLYFRRTADKTSDSSLPFSCDFELSVGSVSSEYVTDNRCHRHMNKKALSQTAENFNENINQYDDTKCETSIILGDVFSRPCVQNDRPLEVCNSGVLAGLSHGRNHKASDDEDPSGYEGNAKTRTERRRYLHKLKMELKKELSKVEKEERCLDKTTTSSNGFNDGYNQLWEIEKENSQRFDTGENIDTDQDDTEGITRAGANPNESEQFSITTDDDVKFAEEEDVNGTTHEETRRTDSEIRRAQTGSDVDLLEIIKDFQQKITNLESQIVALSSKQEKTSHDPYVKVHSVPQPQPTHVPGYPFPYPMFGWPFFGYPSYPVPPPPAQFFPQSPNFTGQPPNINTEARTR